MGSGEGGGATATQNTSVQPGDWTGGETHCNHGVMALGGSGTHHQPVSSPNLIASWIFILASIQMKAGKANARMTPRMA